MKALVLKSLHGFHLDLRMMHLRATSSHTRAAPWHWYKLGGLRLGIPWQTKRKSWPWLAFHIEGVSFVYWAPKLHVHPSKKETGEEDCAAKGPLTEFGWCTKELLGVNMGCLEVDLSKQKTEVKPLQCPELLTWLMAVGIKASGNCWERDFQCLVLDPAVICFTWTCFWTCFVSPVHLPVSERKQLHRNKPERGLMSSYS